ncbi:response regulator [Blastopirellula retiformator]|uniref:Transcriptional regulatory protein YycF n=1 Tax=Blastopirellula retiformator TaxID=2527970 RepID=A0A5C5VNH2_9BACT|nr:response regulator [Blastopirellula retiformator]TWT39627.1 Transcriptional regulatory protein YycF [Blastopirellula retiformator]
MCRNKRVLVIDDETDIQLGVSCWLRHAGYETIIAKDGFEGLEIAGQTTPDLILLDMLMPKMDGLKTLGELRAKTETGDIPVVMLSASLRDEQRALDAGARYFVKKPYEGKRLVSTVNAVFDEAATEPPEVVQP